MRENGARLIVVAMSTSRTHTHRHTQPVGAHSHRTSADKVAAVTTSARFGLRPLCVSDREALRALFARMSPESRRRRFLTGKRELSDRELTYLTNVDHVRHEALTAIDHRDGSIVGVARYVRWPERAGAADVAIEVADDLQRNGIGLMLAEALIERARENGINVLTATTVWENRPARTLLRRLRFRACASHGSEIELELELQPAHDCSRPAHRHRSPVSQPNSEPAVAPPNPPHATSPYKRYRLNDSARASAD
jgi:RimJ/RimL family protein N-acetyltransferase